MNDYIKLFYMDVITYSCPHLDAGLATDKRDPRPLSYLLLYTNLG